MLLPSIYMHLLHTYIYHINTHTIGQARTTNTDNTNSMQCSQTLQSETHVKHKKVTLNVKYNLFCPFIHIACQYVIFSA